MISILKSVTTPMLMIGVCLLFIPASKGLPLEIRGKEIHVFPGDVIQEAVRKAATEDDIHTVLVHEGTYRPAHKAQALVWFNRNFKGIRLKAQGKVILSAANPEIADPTEKSYPAVVNHVLYFGVGVDPGTVVEGFHIQGANNFVTSKHTRLFEPSEKPDKNEYFYHDGGGVKVFGDSGPTLKNLVIEDNFTSPCGAGISVQQEGFNTWPVTIENCILRRNRAQVTGAAIDLLPGSSAVIRNCLFIENASNMGVDVVSLRGDATPFTNNGIITIFATSSAVIEACTFVGNRNGIDEMGGRSLVRGCLFWDNRMDVGLDGAGRFDLDLANGGRILNNAIQGPIMDPKNAVSVGGNQVVDENPLFDEYWIPRNPKYAGFGFRPIPGR